MDPLVRQKLRVARRRLTGEHFLALAAWALFLGLSILVILRALTLLTSTFPSPSVTVIGEIFFLPLLFAALFAITHWWSDRRVAKELDARAATRDRFLTVLDLAADEPTDLTLTVQREVLRFASTLSLSQALRIRISFRRYLWILLPLFALVVLEAIHQVRWARVAPEYTRAKDLLAAVRKAAEEHPEDNPLQEEAQKLEITETQLETSGEPVREALRALADLKQSLAAQAQLTAGEAEALADALSATNPQLASDLRSGQQEAAASNLAQLDPEAAAQALKDAARHVEESRLRELSRQSNEEVQTRLVQMVAASGKSDSARSKFLSQVQDLQSGSSRAQNDPSSAPGEAENDSPAGEEKAAPGEGDNMPPGASPGSEDDKGSGPELLGETDPIQSTSGTDEFLPGTSGEGASLVEIFRASGSDDPETRQTYRSAYDSAQPAALDAVNREDIPPGSRILVRRYFDAIRPKE